MPDLANDLVSHRVAVIAATGGPTVALAAKAATQTIPIVFVIAADPIKLGLVSSFNQPDGNATGVSFLTAALGSKRLELMLALVPKPGAIAVLMNPDNPTSQLELVELQAAAAALAQNLLVLKGNSPDEIEQAFTRLVQQRADALLVTADPVLTSQRTQIVELAASHAIPAIYSDRNFADAGGLMTYGTSVADAYRQVGVYIGQILKGSRPVAALLAPFRVLLSRYMAFADPFFPTSHALSLLPKSPGSPDFDELSVERQTVPTRCRLAQIK